MNAYANNGSSPLRQALEETGRPLTELTVLSVIHDPFRVDTPAGHRDGRWLKDAMEELGVERIHARGLHYALIGVRKSNGVPYTSSDADWSWLCDRALDAARYLGYVPWDSIVDQRNDAPVIREWTPPQPTAYIDTGKILLPEIDGEIDVSPWLHDVRGTQLYRLVIFGEKSSLEAVVSPIAERYQCDLYLMTGEISATAVYNMARTGAADGRPMVVFTISDADPAGWQMPISIARKLQAFKITHFPDLDYQVRRVALLPEQVRKMDLPSSPLKETERRSDRWREATGLEQTEIDALVTLHPDVLRKMLIDAIKLFYDLSLDGRVSEAKHDWLASAQQIIAEHTNHESVAEANQRLEQLRDYVAQEIDEINAMQHIDTRSIKLPEIIVPSAVDNSAKAPEPLVHSDWDFVTQCQRLISSKAYERRACWLDGSL
jgi:hypothetical protein